MTNNQKATSEKKTIVDLQLIATDEKVPKKADFIKWFSLVLKAHPSEKRNEISIRIVDNKESQELNFTYRGKNYPTNVLSFPFEVPDFINSNLLGDLVIAKDVVIKEAYEQNKKLKNHWAHLTIHGILHLLGYDHIKNVDAEVMESLEIRLLAELEINNPYLI